VIVFILVLAQNPDWQICFGCHEIEYSCLISSFLALWRAWKIFFRGNFRWKGRECTAIGKQELASITKSYSGLPVARCNSLLNFTDSLS